MVYAPILVQPDWSLPYELMFDVSDHTIGACLGQRRDKKLCVINYSRRTLTEVQRYYATTKKELLLVVFAFDKFRFYQIGMKVMVYTNHTVIKSF